MRLGVQRAFLETSRSGISRAVFGDFADQDMYGALLRYQVPTTSLRTVYVFSLDTSIDEWVRWSGGTTFGRTNDSMHAHQNIGTTPWYNVHLTQRIR